MHRTGSRVEGPPSRSNEPRRSLEVRQQPMTGESAVIASGSTTIPASSPRVTTFALPAETEHLSSSNASGLNRSGGSILSRITRKLSQSKTQLSRRVSKGSRASREGERSPKVYDKDINDENVPTDEGLRRSKRVLGRSKSERVKRADRLDVSEYFGVASTTPDAEGDSQTRLVWEERLGICWDGREAVHPDLNHLNIPQYSSDADFVPEPRIVYASALSTFPVRPPLKTRNSEPGPSTEPSAQLSDASRVILEYRESCRKREQPALATITSSGEITPAETPRLRLDTDVPTINGQGQPVGYASSVVSAVSDYSASSGSPKRAFGLRRVGLTSEESDTSLDSLADSPIALRTKGTFQNTDTCLTMDTTRPSPLKHFADSAEVLNDTDEHHDHDIHDATSLRSSQIVWSDCLEYQ